MNNHDILILILIATIVSIQLLVFAYALKKIRILKSVFDGIESFKIEKVAIPDSVIATLTPEQVIAGNKSYKEEQEKIAADMQKFGKIKDESDLNEVKLEVDYTYDDDITDNFEYKS